MIFKIESTSELENVKLVMFERTMLPESIRDTVDGKTVFKKTGKEVEYTTYTFRDNFGDKLVLLSTKNDYRTFEGEYVNLKVEVVYNEFQKKNNVKLISCEKADF